LPCEWVEKKYIPGTDKELRGVGCKEITRTEVTTEKAGEGLLSGTNQRTPI